MRVEPMAPAEGSTKTRIAILGGGPAGLATAFGLTSSEDLRNRYEITIYQVGWRVGGKCASGREGAQNRIYENGTHYLFGSYRNAFTTMRQVFAELEAAGEHRYGSFNENFLPRSLVAIKQFFNGSWETWRLQLPTNFSEPGSGNGTLAARDQLTMVVQWMVELLSGASTLSLLQRVGAFPTPLDKGPLRRIVQQLRADVDQAIAYGGVKLLELAASLAAVGFRGVSEADVLGVVAHLVKCFRCWLWVALRGSVHCNLHAYRLWTTLDLGCSAVIGMIEDRVYEPGGFEAIDKYDLRQWLARHGANEWTLACEQLQTWYNAVAAYRRGNIETPEMSAAVGLQSLIRLGLEYEGAFAYQMDSEVGDSVIAPLYQCLKNRGVRFAFFHRVWDVIPGDGDQANWIEGIDVEQQLELKNGDELSYRPFIPVKGRNVWPNQPNWSQIKEQDRNAPDTDSFYIPCIGTRRTLKRGVDFDLAVYAMPVATIPFYAKRLMERRRVWRDLTNLRTVETQSLRLWWSRSLKGLGWPWDPPVLSGYVQPLATWEDNGQLIRWETWPATDLPLSLSTVFGPLPCEDTSPGPEHVDYPKDKQKLGVHTMKKFLRFDVGSLWPDATAMMNKVGVNWDLLVDPEHRHGAARFESQHARVNVGPTERYTLAGVDTLKYRLRTDETQFGNLFIAGDWVRNGMELGSVEGAVMSGLLCSRAICGSPEEIPGSEGV